MRLEELAIEVGALIGARTSFSMGCEVELKVLEILKEHYWGVSLEAGGGEVCLVLDNNRAVRLMDKDNLPKSFLQAIVIGKPRGEFDFEKWLNDHAVEILAWKSNQKINPSFDHAIGELRRSI